MNLKSYCPVIALLMLSTPMPILAGSGHDVLRGALVGAATGALLAEVSSDIHARTAIPLLAGLGALTGYSMHQARNNDYYYDSRDKRYDHDTHYYPYAPARHYRQRWNRSLTPPLPEVRSAALAPATKTVQQQTLNRHPGLERIPVQIALPSGFPLTIHITYTGKQWVGPRGETYTNMPNAQQLQQIYKP